MKKIITLFIALAPLTSFASEMALDLQFDEDGKATPVTSYAHDWTETLYSQVKYRSLAITEQDTSQALSRSAASIDEQFVQLSFLGYKQKNDNSFWSVGGGVELIRINNNEFGFGEFSNEILIIENDVEITSTRALITSGAGFQSSLFSIKGGLDIKPAGNLSVKQDTVIEYGSEFSGGTENSYSADFSYGLNVDGIVFTNLGFDIGFGAEYIFLPLKYDLARANSSLSEFEDVTIQQDETTTRYSLRFILGQETEMGRPMVGITNETLAISSGGDTKESTINYLVVGFDKRF